MSDPPESAIDGRPALLRGAVRLPSRRSSLPQKSPLGDEPKMIQHEESPRIDRRAFARRVAAIASGLWGLAGEAGGGVAPPAVAPIRVRIWSEGTAPHSVYPGDIDGAIGDSLRRAKDWKVTQARLGDPGSGLSDQDLDATAVLIWWGRLRQADVKDHRAQAIADRVRAGRLGFVALHASCGGKPFQELMGCPCEPSGWREDGKAERVAVVRPGHPIARGVAPFTIPRVAMFREPFKVPTPEDVVLSSTFEGGETFPSGLTWTIGRGRVAYFRPGHEGFPVFFPPRRPQGHRQRRPLGLARPSRLIGASGRPPASVGSMTSGRG